MTFFLVLFLDTLNLSCRTDCTCSLTFFPVLSSLFFSLYETVFEPCIYFLTLYWFALLRNKIESCETVFGDGALVFALTAYECEHEQGCVINFLFTLCHWRGILYFIIKALQMNWQFLFCYRFDNLWNFKLLLIGTFFITTWKTNQNIL